MIEKEKKIKERQMNIKIDELKENNKEVFQKKNIY